MKLYKKINIKRLNEDLYHGKYLIKPFEKGIGMTIGNSIRRILLSSIPGYSVYAIKINDILHEFSSVEGIDIDVPILIQRIKGLFIKVNPKIYDETIDEDSLKTEEIIKLELYKKTSGPVKASDIKCPPGVEIVNKDYFLFNLESKNTIDIKMIINNNRGYASFKVNNDKYNTFENKYIIIDTIYSPILMSNFKVSEIIVHKNLKEEELLLEIKTDHSITADEALSKATKILIDHLKVLKKFVDPDFNKKEEINLISILDEKKQDHILGWQIEHLNLTKRTYNALKRANIHVIKEIINLSKIDLNKISNFGEKAKIDLFKALQEKGIDTSNLK